MRPATHTFTRAGKPPRASLDYSRRAADASDFVPVSGEEIVERGPAALATFPANRLDTRRGWIIIERTAPRSERF